MADKTPEKTEHKTEVVIIPTAIRHKVLEDISTQLHNVEISDLFEIAGHKYEMSVLTSDEEVWADSYTNLTSQMSAITSMKIPRLSASIKSIDGVKVDDLFKFSDDANKADTEYHSQSQYRKRYWVMNQMLIWLGDKPKSLANDLWIHYGKLIERRDAAWEELKKSSARIPGGESKVSSSPVKESSPAIQTLSV